MGFNQDLVVEVALDRRPRDDMAYTVRACGHQVGWLRNGAREPIDDDLRDDQRQ